MSRGGGQAWGLCRSAAARPAKRLPAHPRRAAAGTLLKPNMVTAGVDSGGQASEEEVAAATVRVHRRPAAPTTVRLRLRVSCMRHVKL